MQIELGKTYIDKITGFKGVAVGVVYYISGCNQVLISPKVDKDGKIKDSNWFDVQRMKEEKVKRISLDNEKTPGFDMEAPKR